MKMISNKRLIHRIIYIVLGIVTLGLFIFLGYYFFFRPDKGHMVIFLLKGNDKVEIEYGNAYSEEGVMVLVDNNDMSNLIKIDNDDFDINKLGEYSIRYYFTAFDKVYSTYRRIRIVDHVKPKLVLKGKEKVNLLLNEDYKDEGAIATDNYDGDITAKIKIESDLNTGKTGEYKIIYRVEDTSGNSSEISRIVKVSAPKKVIVPDNNENKENKKELDYNKYANTITKSNFTSNGFSIEGYKKENNGTYTLTLRGDKEYSFALTSGDNGIYRGSIDLSLVENGLYDAYIVSGSEEKLYNKMDFISRLGRAKIHDKLVSFTYKDDVVKIDIQDFAYKYDVLIDPGHGGVDPGASNEYIYEKEMNLLVSLYEKCRYEESGFSVYMTRENDTYGNGMGDNSLEKLHRRAYEMGYIGAVSRIVYSNHHNSIGYGNYMGYEILIPGRLTKDELSLELTIANKFNSIYPLKEEHLRFYARDYDTEVKFSKLNGEIYTFKDNYAVNRIPYNLFNVKSIIYEGAYLSNKDDFNWYWNDENWIKVSEAKLEVYINYLGGTYNPDNSVCYDVIKKMN